MKEVKEKEEDEVENQVELPKVESQVVEENQVGVGNPGVVGSQVGEEV